MGLVGWKDVGLKFRLWVDFYNGRRIMVFPNHNNVWLLLCAHSRELLHHEQPRDCRSIV